MYWIARWHLFRCRPTPPHEMCWTAVPAIQEGGTIYRMEPFSWRATRPRSNRQSPLWNSRKRSTSPKRYYNGAIIYNISWLTSTSETITPENTCSNLWPRNASYCSRKFNVSRYRFFGCQIRRAFIQIFILLLALLMFAGNDLTVVTSFFAEASSTSSPVWKYSIIWPVVWWYGTWWLRP